MREQFGCPVVSIVHLLRSSASHHLWQNAFSRCVQRQYLSGVDALIYDSATTRREAEHLIGHARDPKPASLVAHPSSDRLDPQISNGQLTNRALGDPLRLLFLGNVIPRNGLHVALKALELLPDINWTLTVIGSPDAHPSYARGVSRQIERAGLAAHVQFAGVLPDRELSEYMRASHVLVMPSSYEGYGIVYVEAMGFGLPAIGTTSGAAREIISTVVTVSSYHLTTRLRSPGV